MSLRKPKRVVGKGAIGLHTFQCLFAIPHRFPYYDITFQIIEINDRGPFLALLRGHCCGRLETGIRSCGAAIPQGHIALSNAKGATGPKRRCILIQICSRQ